MIPDIKHASAGTAERLLSKQHISTTDTSDFKTSDSIMANKFVHDHCLAMLVHFRSSISLMHAGPGHHLTLTLCSVLLISKSRMSIVNTPTWFSTSIWWNWLKLLNTSHTDWIPTLKSTLRLPSSRKTLARVGSRVAWDSKGSKCWACLNRLAMQLAALALSLTSSSYKFSCST